MRLTHSKRNEIYLKVTRAEIAGLRHELLLLMAGKSRVELQCSVDLGVFKTASGFDIARLECGVSEVESLSRSDDRAVLRLCTESFELMDDFLSALMEGEPVMPELAEIEVEGWSKERTLGLLLDGNESDERDRPRPRSGSRLGRR